jgi:hypothetical protein
MIPGEEVSTTAMCAIASFPLLRRDGDGMARCVLQFGATGGRRIKSVVNEEWRRPDLKLLTPDPQPVVTPK